jgi:hypothetical protein
MKFRFIRSWGLVAALALAPNLAAQVVQLVELLEKEGPGGPAPKHDVFGAWAGPNGPKGTCLHARRLARFKLNKPGTFRYSSNDPYGSVILGVFRVTCCKNLKDSHSVKCRNALSCE